MSLPKTVITQKDYVVVFLEIINDMPNISTSAGYKHIADIIQKKKNPTSIKIKINDKIIN